MNARVFLPLVLLLGLLLAPGASAEEPRTATEQLIDAHADSIVSIKFVLTTRLNFMGQAQDEESNVEVRGVVIGEDGLILTSSSHFEGGMAGRVLRVMGTEIDMDTSVSDLKVLFQNESEEYDAQVVAKDSNLGLAFVQILELGDRNVQALSLEGGGAPRIGEDLLGLTRLARGFDCAPMVGRLYVAAPVERPRRMWAVHGNFDGQGLPVFQTSGRLAGFLSMQEGAEGTQSESSGGMFGLAGAAEQMGLFLLPADAVVPLVAAARKRAVEMRARAEEEAAAAAD